MGRKYNYKVFFTWTDDKGRKKFGFTYMFADNAKEAERKVKREKRPFKAHNIEAKRYD